MIYKNYRNVVEIDFLFSNENTIWEQGVAGSNPATPTKFCRHRQKIIYILGLSQKYQQHNQQQYQQHRILLKIMNSAFIDDKLVDELAKGKSLENILR